MPITPKTGSLFHAESQPELALGPDGKVIVCVRDEGNSWSLDGFSCSLQRREAADDVALHRAIRLAIQEELSQLARALPGLSPKVPDALTVNGAGAFEVGGPEGDNGLSGKKLVVDAYGPRIQIGGGAWSGKDFFKADRAGGRRGPAGLHRCADEGDRGEPGAGTRVLPEQGCSLYY